MPEGGISRTTVTMNTLPLPRVRRARNRWQRGLLLLLLAPFALVAPSVPAHTQTGPIAGFLSGLGF